MNVPLAVGIAQRGHHLASLRVQLLKAVADLLNAALVETATCVQSLEM